MAKESPTQPAPVDLGFKAIVALAIVVAIWLLLMPWVPAIASSTMHRFHLRSGSFTWWAIQQPIPSMYNFANRYEVRELPPGLLDPILETSDKRYINHFPARTLTFANTRFRYLHEGQDRWMTIDSSYRGQTLESRYLAQHRESGGFDLILLSKGGDR